MSNGKPKGWDARARLAMATTLGEIIKPVGLSRLEDEDRLEMAYNDLVVTIDSLVEDQELSSAEISAVLAKRLAQEVAGSMDEPDKKVKKARKA
jgi:hypothetical protein